LGLEPQCPVSEESALNIGYLKAKKKTLFISDLSTGSQSTFPVEIEAGEDFPKNN